MIGHWKQWQRVKFQNQNLKPEEEKALIELGEDFDINKRRSFEEMIYIIMIYMHKTSKKYSDICYEDIYNGIKIGAWKQAQKLRYKNKKLGKKEESLLRELGENFEFKEMISFDAYVEIIKEYMSETGKQYSEIKQSTVYKNVKIGLWKRHQRYKYQNKELSQKEETILIQLGENFDIKDIIKFEEMIYIIMIYMHKTGKSYAQIRQTDVYEGIGIGVWKYRQRAYYKQGKLSEDQIIILKNLGEDFKPLKIRKTVANAKLEKNSIPTQTAIIEEDKTKKLS